MKLFTQRDDKQVDKDKIPATGGELKMSDPIQEASGFLKTYNTNKNPGIQLDEININFVEEFLAKAETVQENILNKLTPAVLDEFSCATAFVANGHHSKGLSAKALARAKKLVGYKSEPSIKGVTILLYHDTKGKKHFGQLKGYSHLLLGSKSSTISRVYC